MVKVLPEHARAHNRSMVLQHLFHAGPTSRADLARSTGLTRVTVSDLVAELIAEGLVEELGLRTEARVGKPATLVGMRTEDYQIVAIDLADDAWIRGAVMSLVGGVVVRRAARLDGRAGEAALDLLAELAKELLAAATRPVIGIGIGSPGVIDRDGVVIEAPNRDWYDVPLASILTSRLGVPVHVGNDANTRALGEYTYGGASGDGLLVLTVGQGVGAGIVMDGMLLSGHANAAGEVGQVQGDGRALRHHHGLPRVARQHQRGHLSDGVQRSQPRARVLRVQEVARVLETKRQAVPGQLQLDDRRSPAAAAVQHPFLHRRPRQLVGA